MGNTLSSSKIVQRTFPDRPSIGISIGGRLGVSLVGGCELVLVMSTVFVAVTVFAGAATFETFVSFSAPVVLVVFAALVVLTISVAPVAYVMLVVLVGLLGLFTLLMTS